jgi:hypothetical protein
MLVAWYDHGPCAFFVEGRQLSLCLMSPSPGAFAYGDIETEGALYGPCALTPPADVGLRERLLALSVFLSSLSSF